MNHFVNNQALRIVILTQPGNRGVQEYRFDQPEIYVGRVAQGNSNGATDLRLDADIQVSRRHARLVRRGEQWLIEDPDSKHGTSVDGHNIKGQGLVIIEPGTPIQTGSTTWTLLPADWLAFTWNNALFYAPCLQAISYALYHSDLPVLGPLTLRNFGPGELAPVRLNLIIPGYSESCEIDTPGLAPGTVEVLPPPVLNLRAEWLKTQTGVGHTSLRVWINGSPFPPAEKPLKVLGFWEVSLEKQAIKSLAAYVLPRNNIVECIIDDVCQHLSGLMGAGSLSALLRQARDDGEKLALQALYQCLKIHWQVQWKPPLFNTGFQTVLPPHRVFSRPANRQGEGTCLDLSLLLAGCLENTGLFPLIILTGTQPGGPTHALVGCWAGATPGGRPLVFERERILQEVQAGNLWVIEANGFAEQVNAGGNKLDFEEAMYVAVQKLGSAEWFCALDIGALRPPRGTVNPIDCPYEPEVLMALAKSQELAQVKNRPQLDLGCLLFGLLTARGEITRCLGRLASLDFDGTEQKLRDRLEPGSFSGEPEPTRNYQLCQKLAEDFARRDRAPGIREQDLWWALLTQGAHSASFRKAWRYLDLDLARWTSDLERLHPRPQIIDSLSDSEAEGIKPAPS